VSDGNIGVSYVPPWFEYPIGAAQPGIGQTASKPINRCIPVFRASPGDLLRKLEEKKLTNTIISRKARTVVEVYDRRQPPKQWLASFSL
jgi:hypothetical protein